jgi:hypothetical protein
MLQLQLLPVIVTQLTACVAVQQKQLAQASPPRTPPPRAAAAAVSEGRLAELCCGILANLYGWPALAPSLAAAADLTAVLLQLFDGGALGDPLALAELCRLLAAALSTHEVRCSVRACVRVRVRVRARARVCECACVCARARAHVRA